MDEAIKDLIGQAHRRNPPTLTQAARNARDQCYVLCNNAGFFIYTSPEELEEAIANAIESLMILAVHLHLSPIEHLVRRLNRRITDADD